MRWVAPLMVSMAFTLYAAAGCGQADPKETAYKFLGAVQSQDYAAAQGCVNPEALRKADEAEDDLAYQREELKRRYVIDPVTWRMEFDNIRLEVSFLDSEHALVRICGGRCVLYNLKDDIWVEEGEIDFSTDDFSPLYMVMKEGDWYLEALDLYIIYGLECLARV
ncbi:MAG: hypothetical protein SWK76_06255 [Actinomycetota bacterium]|nr:hypothetical protein [Actinomycetota bacterium]